MRDYGMRMAPAERYLSVGTGLLVLSGLYLSSLYSYLLFHSLVELSSISVAFAIFMLTWNSRRFLGNGYLLFISISFLFVGGIDLIHTLAYKGMNIFAGYTADLPTQLWIARGYLQAASLLIAPFFLGRGFEYPATFAAYSAASVLLVGSVFTGYFPSCYVEGAGLTSFKILSEYIISGLFLASFILLYRKRHALEESVFLLISASIILTIGSELAFTSYVSVYDLSNLVGHSLKLFAYYLLYRAIVVTGLIKPYKLLFKERQKTEEEIILLNNELQRRLAELDAANRELEAFSYSVSHDLRAPLTAISGFSRILAADYGAVLDEEAKDFLSRIHAASERMSLLISDLLNLSRLSTSEMSLSDVDLGSLAQKICEELRQREPERLADCFIREGATVRGDVRLLRIALENLIGNAWKFTGGRHHARIEFGTLEYGALRQAQGDTCHGERVEPGRPVYFLRDNGAGFDMTYADKLFLPFQRLHSASEFSGMGIGLATVKRIINRHGGSIWAESVVDKGTTFYFTL